jgi:hypothetical protein
MDRQVATISVVVVVVVLTHQNHKAVVQAALA